MTVTDLIMKLTQLPPDLEVCYDGTVVGEDRFTLIVIQDAIEIETDSGDKLILLEAEIDNDKED